MNREKALELVRKARGKLYGAGLLLAEAIEALAQPEEEPEPQQKPWELSASPELDRAACEVMEQHHASFHACRNWSTNPERVGQMLDWLKERGWGVGLNYSLPHLHYSLPHGRTWIVSEYGHERVFGATPAEALSRAVVRVGAEGAE